MKKRPTAVEEFGHQMSEEREGWYTEKKEVLEYLIDHRTYFKINSRGSGTIALEK